MKHCVKKSTGTINVRVTVISPGIIDTNLPDSVNDEDVAEHVRKGYEALAVPPERVANAIAYTINSERYIF